MVNKFKQYLQKEQFQPGVFALFFNPFYFARKGLFKNIAAMVKYVNGRILDIGCGQKPYKKLFNSSRYIGLELDLIF